MRKSTGHLLVGSVLATAVSCLPPSPAVDSHGNVTVRPASQSIRTQGLELFHEYKRSRKISQNASFTARVRHIGTRLQSVVSLPGAQWEYVVFEDAEPNAFALPGGKVGVHTGLFEIARTDGELAAVLAHEIAHLTSNHAEDRISQQARISLGGALLGEVLGGDAATRETVGEVYDLGAQVGFGLPFSRHQELEADRIGMIFMARAGYDPAEAITLWQRFAAYQQRTGGEGAEFLRTHPVSSTRIQALREFLPVAQRQLRR